MDVVGLPEFMRCMRAAARTASDRSLLDDMILRLSTQHSTSEMQNRELLIPGTNIRLWATSGLQLSGGEARVTWRYEECSGRDMAVCFTLVHA